MDFDNKMVDLVEKWQKIYESENLFNTEIENREKYFINVPYPYVNGPPHIGHSYTYIRTDVMAKFKALQGYNVLFAQGFHATGEPIVSVIKRLKKNDKTQIKVLKDFGMSDEEIEKFKESAENIVNFWIKEWMYFLNKTGFSIDWRRKFITTELTPEYSRFIEWQYNRLKEKGYVIQGTHPVIWCPSDESPTGDHDRLEGEGESPSEYTIIKLKSDDKIFPAATLRPETIYGITNIWVNPEGDYVEAEVNGEKWIISQECVKKLKDQLKKINISRQLKGAELIGIKCENPVTGKTVPVLPSSFVKTGNATGIVMSVPSHAPYDYIALKEIIKNSLDKYGLTEEELNPIQIIDVEGFNKDPAIEVCESMGIKSLSQGDKIEKATKEVYKKEFHKGILNEKCGKYSSMSVVDAKDKIIEDLKNQKIADSIWEPTAKVVCRCTTETYVKILENQWFLNFSDEGWKSKVRECLSNMLILPEEAKQNFENTIEWLKDKACTRKSGLGTPLPWDKSSIVETLSDSTIYMAYYTISGIINEKKIKKEDLTDEVFDYIFLDKDIKENNIDREILDNMKRQFEYFYPFDIRFSGKDLIQNHLTYMLFHHTALWDKDKWPKGVSVNGFVSVEGEKMSKSKGNIIPIKKMLEKYTPDMIRINIAGSSENLQDADWKSENIDSIKNKLSILFKDITDGEGDDSFAIKILENELNTGIKYYETCDIRKVVQHCFMNTTKILNKYSKIMGKDTKNKLLEKISIVLYPIMPFVCEELWENLGNERIILKNKKALEIFKKILESEPDYEFSEIVSFVHDIIEDIKEISKLVQNKSKATIFIAEQWKSDAINMIIEGKSKDEIIRNLSENNVDLAQCSKFVAMNYSKKRELLKPMSNQKEHVQSFVEMIKSDIKIDLEILSAEDSNEVKARASTPNKPGILLS